jgi:anaerobic selenocysteine-containing dehydrogenase
VSSDVGSLTCQVVCSDTQRRDLVLIPRGGWGILGCNVNVLTRDLVSKVGKGTPYYETRVRIEKPEQEATQGEATEGKTGGSKMTGNSKER